LLNDPVFGTKAFPFPVALNDPVTFAMPTSFANVVLYATEGVCLVIKLALLIALLGLCCEELVMLDVRDGLVVEAVEALRESAEALRSRFAKRCATTIDRIADSIERRRPIPGKCHMCHCDVPSGGLECPECWDARQY